MRVGVAREVENRACLPSVTRPDVLGQEVSS